MGFSQEGVLGPTILAGFDSWLEYKSPQHDVAIDKACVLSLTAFIHLSVSSVFITCHLLCLREM